MIPLLAGITLRADASDCEWRAAHSLTYGHAVFAKKFKDYRHSFGYKLSYINDLLDCDLDPMYIVHAAMMQLDGGHQ